MANTYISRTFGTPTNSAIWTLSFWIKRSSLSPSTSQKIFSAGTGSTDRTEISFAGGNDGLNIYRNISGSTAGLDSTRKFRDCNAWYHIVIQNNSGTAAVYVNGEAETMSSTSLGTNKINLASTIHIFGDQVASGQNFDGLMSHIHFVDGTIYAPTVFGSTDSVTGEWQINTSPSITMGNNGFTILKDSNTITDQSTNSNDFSLSSGTLTNTEDNPSNVFNVFSDTTSKKAYVSEGGLKVSETATSWNIGVGGTIGASSGKYYWEFYKTASSDNFITGIIPSNEFHRLAESTASAVYNNANAIQVGASTSWWYKIGTGSSTTLSGYGHGSGSKSSGLFQLAVDLTNKKMWIGKDGTWYNSGNPETGANPLWTGSTVFPDDIYVPYWQGYGTVSGRFNFGGGSFGSDAVASAGTNASANGVFELNVPTGFTALSTKGLNL